MAPQWVAPQFPMPELIFAVGTQTALYTFTGGADGAQPGGGVIGDGQGSLYCTASGGANGKFGNGCGVIFEYNIASGHLTVLHTFTGPDGAVPMAGLVRDAQATFTAPRCSRLGLALNVSCGVWSTTAEGAMHTGIAKNPHLGVHQRLEGGHWQDYVPSSQDKRGRGAGRERKYPH